MVIGRWRNALAGVVAACLVLTVLILSITPASAQNRKKAWEIFIYFGEYGGQTVPSAIQQGVISTYRIDPFFAAKADPTAPFDTAFCAVCQNAGATGPDNIYLNPVDPNGTSSPPLQRPCYDPNTQLPLPSAFDPANPYLDECDDDMEAIYRYNPNGIVTNGQVQKNDSEFLLGGRVGYNFTRHWEIEMDLGFAKQRLDMTKNLIPVLKASVSNPADPYFTRLAEFYQFTWANTDFQYLGYDPVYFSDPNTLPDVRGMQEIPNVPQHRRSKNAAADIPAMLPMPLLPAETFADVTDFVNRVYLSPGAFRNRANQVNIDILSIGLTGVYNFNTKPDSRIVPYLQAGLGTWMRSFDAPYKGEDTNYFTYGGGVRFFVNEIFNFRAEFRQMVFRQDKSTIDADLPKQNLLDNGGRNGCYRDQDPPAQEPPQECTQSFFDRYVQGLAGPRPSELPANFFKVAGGNASVSFETETDNFWEMRIGFDLLLGGK